MNYSVVSGGAALIGTSLIAATGLFTPAVGALVLGNICECVIKFSVVLTSP